MGIINPKLIKNNMKNQVVTYVLLFAILLVGIAGLMKKDSLVGGATNYDDLAVDSITVSGAITTGGSITASGGVTTVGDSKIDNLISRGDITVASSSASASLSLTAAQMCNSSEISVIPSAGNINVTLAATSTLFADCLTTNGDSITFDYVNGATAATSTTLVAGAGIDLESDDSNGDVIAQNGTAEITCLRNGATTARCKVKPFTNAD